MPKSAACQPASLVFSFSLDSAVAEAAVQVGSPDPSFERLLVLLGERSHGASWIVNDPVGPLAQRLRAASRKHEIVLAADRRWAGLLRPQLAADLASRMNRARAAGYPTSALAVRSAAGPLDADLLLSAGIATVLTPRQAIAGWWPGCPTVQPRRLCYGLWQLPVSLAIGLDGGFWQSRRLLAAVRRAIRSAADHGAVVHIRGELSGSAAHNRRLVAEVAALLHAAEQVSSERLVVEPAGQLLQRRTATRPATSSHSILHPRRAA